jgi:large subunit ribosomal protein L37Ae
MPKSKRKDSFGVRYGVKARSRVKEIEGKQRIYHLCPKCGKRRVKRTGTGVWKCKKCGVTFAGGAYLPQTTPGIEVEKNLKSIVTGE